MKANVTAHKDYTISKIDDRVYGAFLEHLEDLRKNAAVTRNVRLAAIKSFFRFLEYRQPAALDQVRRVLAIPFKKTDTRLVPYLLREELQALLDAPNPATRDGIRDRAMLHVAVCAGLRVSELTGLTINDLDEARRGAAVWLAEDAVSDLGEVRAGGDVCVGSGGAGGACAVGLHAHLGPFVFVSKRFSAG